MSSISNIIANVSYDNRSVHFSRRAYDKKFEVVARLMDPDAAELGFHPGQEVVLDVQPTRERALDSVRTLRDWKGTPAT